MRGSAPRLGYYIIGVGIVLQSLGLSFDAWFGTAEASGGAMLSLSNPGDVILGLGMAVILAGTVIGLFGQAPETLSELRPAIVPPVLLAVFSIGSMAFAYQIGGLSNDDIPGSPSVASAQECPDGFYWHPVMNHCMLEGTEAVTPVDDGGESGVPTCPEGFYWHQVMNHCMENGTTAVAPIDDDGDPNTTPVCPDGYYWHPSMNHCMENGTSAVTPVDDDDDPNTDPTCPEGYYWHPSMNHCMVNGTVPGTPVPPGQPTPVCPPGTFWMPSMGHCMPNAPVTPNPTPPNGTPTPTPVCPPGTFWMPEMNHCMPVGGPGIFIASPEDGGQADTDLAISVGVSNVDLNLSDPNGWHWHLTIDGVPQPGGNDIFEVDPGVTLDQGPHTIRVALYRNSADPVLVASDEATFIALDDPDVCPPGYVWHPVMGHCMAITCPPPLVFDWDTLYCDLPPTATPTQPPPPDPTPTPEPTPSCPAGYFWHPLMGHCMSETCPPPLVLDPVTLFCDLPPTPAPAVALSALPPSQPALVLRDWTSARTT